MRIIEYTAHNIMRLRDIHLSLKGRHLFIVGGKTDEGKTSALTSLLIAMCGKSGMEGYPDVVLREGETEGWITVRTTGDEDMHEPVGYTIEYKVTKKARGNVVEELRLLDSTGEEASEPRTTLKSFYQLKAFDPLAFEKLPKKDKLALILKLLGLDFSEQKAEAKRLYDERTLLNKDVKKLEAKLGVMKKWPDVPADEVSLKDLIAEYERRAGVNAENKKSRLQLEQLDTSVARLDDEILSIKRQMEQLRKNLDDQETSRDAYIDKADTQREWVVKLVDLDVEATKLEISEATETNKKVRDNLAHADTYKQMMAVALKADDLTRTMENLTVEQEKAVKAAKFPVPGMSFDDEGVLLNGLPIEQASKRQRIEASVDIGIALNPKLKLMVSQDGGCLDEESMIALDKKLEAWGGTMIVEMVTRGKSDEDLCAVIIKDGYVAQTNEPSFTPDDFTVEDLENEGFFNETDLT